LLTHCDELNEVASSDAEPPRALRLALSPDEVIERLTRALDRDRCPWLGHFCGRRFQLSAPDPWAPVLHGEVVHWGDGALLRTRFAGSSFHRQQRRVVRASIAVLGLGGLALALTGIGAELGTSPSEAALAAALLTATFFLLFEACELWAHHLGGKARRELDGFCRTLLASGADRGG
jgi:hypothetical protein